jgi:hypothetical protein
MPRCCDTRVVASNHVSGRYGRSDPRAICLRVARRIACRCAIGGYTRAPATNRPDGQITSDFQKLRQARQLKIFRFRSYANQGHIIRHPVPREGASAIVTNVGQGAVDADALLTKGADAYGEVVWAIFWHSVKHAETKKTLQNKHSLYRLVAGCLCGFCQI